MLRIDACPNAPEADFGGSEAEHLAKLAMDRKKSWRSTEFGGELIFLEGPF